MLKLLTDIVEDIGACLLFVKDVVVTAFTTPCTFESVCEQIWTVSMQSLATTAMAGGQAALSAGCSSAPP